MVKRYKTFDPQLVVVEHTTGSAVVLTNEAKLSLYKKSQKSGISTDILEEVYVRGYSIWNESFGQTPEQFAFDRVNSFVAGGFAAQLDDDLIEAYFSQTKPNQGFEHKGKVIGAISKSADGYISRRRKDPDKPTSVHLMQKHKTREDAEKHLISKSGLGEEYTGAEKVSKSSDDASSRFIGTDSLTDVYKKATPGYTKTIKRVVKEHCGCKKVDEDAKGYKNPTRKALALRKWNC